MYPYKLAPFKIMATKTNTCKWNSIWFQSHAHMHFNLQCNPLKTYQPLKFESKKRHHEQEAPDHRKQNECHPKYTRFLSTNSALLNFKWNTNTVYLHANSFFFVVVAKKKKKKSNQNKCSKWLACNSGEWKAEKEKQWLVKCRLVLRSKYVQSYLSLFIHPMRFAIVIDVIPPS